MRQEEYEGTLRGARILVAAGATRAYIDAVRFISNTSTGRLGAIIAEECLRRGAVVTFVHGLGCAMPTLDPETSMNLTSIEVETVGDFLEILRETLRGGNQHVCIHPMAVLDYLPERINGGKIPSDKSSMNLKLVRGPKIIEQVKNIAPTTLLVGFKLENNASEQQLLKRAEDLMARSGADIVVANDQAKITETDHPALICVKTTNGTETINVDGKPQIARILCEQVQNLLAKKREGIRRSAR